MLDSLVSRVRTAVATCVGAHAAHAFRVERGHAPRGTRSSPPRCRRSRAGGPGCRGRGSGCRVAAAPRTRACGSSTPPNSTKFGQLRYGLVAERGEARARCGRAAPRCRRPSRASRRRARARRWRPPASARDRWYGRRTSRSASIDRGVGREVADARARERERLAHRARDDQARAAREQRERAVGSPGRELGVGLVDDDDAVGRVVGGRDGRRATAGCPWGCSARRRRRCRVVPRRSRATARLGRELEVGVALGRRPTRCRCRRRAVEYIEYVGGEAERGASRARRRPAGSAAAPRSSRSPPRCCSGVEPVAEVAGERRRAVR